MSNKIQITEQQAIEMFSEIFKDYFDAEVESRKIIYRLKECGYIKRSELEIYTEFFYSLEPKDVKYENCINYIEALEKEIERLRNE